MIKNNRGITLIILVVMIVLLIILASISVNSGTETISLSKYNNAVSEMKVMQAKVNELHEEYVSGDDTVKNEIENYGSLTDAKAINAYNSVKDSNSDIVGSINDYRYYSVDYINDTLDTEGISHDFIINIKNRMVILVDGITYDGMTYYSLCQIDGETYNVQYEG